MALPSHSPMAARRSWAAPALPCRPRRPARPSATRRSRGQGRTTSPRPTPEMPSTPRRPRLCLPSPSRAGQGAAGGGGGAARGGARPRRAAPRPRGGSPLLIKGAQRQVLRCADDSRAAPLPRSSGPEGVRAVAPPARGRPLHGVHLRNRPRGPPLAHDPDHVHDRPRAAVADPELKPLKTLTPAPMRSRPAQRLNPRPKPELVGRDNGQWHRTGIPESLAKVLDLVGRWSVAQDRDGPLCAETGTLAFAGLLCLRDRMNRALEWAREVARPRAWPSDALWDVRLPSVGPACSAPCYPELHDAAPQPSFA